LVTAVETRMSICLFSRCLWPSTPWRLPPMAGHVNSLDGVGDYPTCSQGRRFGSPEPPIDDAHLVQARTKKLTAVSSIIELSSGRLGSNCSHQYWLVVRVSAEATTIGALRKIAETQFGGVAVTGSGRIAGVGRHRAHHQLMLIELSSKLQGVEWERGSREMTCWFPVYIV
jgi:hypothetical protein